MGKSLSFSERIGEQFTLLNATILNSRIIWSIRWRWVANIGFFLLILISRSSGLQLDYDSIWLTLIFLASLNLIYQGIYRYKKKYTLMGELAFISIHIFMDILILTWLIHLTGGIENPLYFFYIFHIIISSIIFPRNLPYVVTTFVFVLFAVLVWAEYSNLIMHHCIYKGQLHESPVLNILIVAIFFTTVFLTTHICTSFMKLFRKSQREVTALNKLLLEKEKEKSSFYRYTSHELKAPVVSIKTSIDAVLAASGPKLPEQSRQLLKRASLRAGQMLSMLKELLELSWQQSKGRNVSSEYIDLQEILNLCVDLEKAVAESRNIRFEFITGEDIPKVRGDKNSLEKLFGNLVGNAVRYNRDGGTVRIRIIKKENGVCVEISDEGIGIAVEEQERIFDPFYRSAAAKEFTPVGTGLGLSMVRQIVDNLGGRIEVESFPEKGSTFRVCLPPGEEK